MKIGNKKPAQIRLSEDEEQILAQMGLTGSNRRSFLKQVSAASLSILASTYFTSDALAEFYGQPTRKSGGIAQ